MESQSATPIVVQRVRGRSLVDLLRRSALRYPDKLALVSGELRWTYAEFDGAVNRTAAALSGRVEKGDRLALLSHNCWQFAVLNFALARLGVILVPINFMLGADEIAYILRDSGASGFITEDALHAVAQQAIDNCGMAGGVRGWISLGGQAAAGGWEDVTTWADHPDDRTPEVIVADDEWHSLPLYHCAQLDCFLGPDVYLGATSIILPRPDPDVLLRAIESERVTKLFAPPTVWISLLRSRAFDATDLSSLRKGYYGASAMPVEVLREIQQRLPDVRLWNFYGQTEMAPLATILQPEEQVSHAGSAGRPAVNVETKLVDDQNNDVPTGTIGEIVHRSPHATLGYWNEEAKTAEAFRGGWFHSGDLGMFDEDGYLFIVDRKKDMIKTGGENVASLEVEQAIYLMEEVSEVAVFGIADPKWIEAVVAAVVPKQSAALSPEAVIAHCRSTLAVYKAPKHVVILDSL